MEAERDRLAAMSANLSARLAKKSASVPKSIQRIASYKPASSFGSENEVVEDAFEADHRVRETLASISSSSASASDVPQASDAATKTELKKKNPMRHIPEFLPSLSFTGPKTGMYFGLGYRGLGYASRTVVV